MSITPITKIGVAGLAIILALLARGPPTVHGNSPPIYEHPLLETTKGRPAYVPGQLILEFTSVTKPELQSQVLDGFNLRLIEQLDIAPFALVEFEPGSGPNPSQGRTPLTVAQELLQHSAVASAEPNYYRYAHFEPNDAYFAYQWHLHKIQMQQAWDQSTGAGVTVAVVDSGVAYETYGGYQQAPDLAGTTFVPGYDFINNDDHPNDDNSHGTHVAGTIAQTTNNNLGVAGIAFGARIMPVKVLDASGAGSAWQAAQGVQWAVDHGADVINLSLGSSSSSSVEQSAVRYAYDHGVTMVASAGNDGTSSVGYPAAYDVVIAVGAVRYDETLASYSDHGPALDIVAPGGDTQIDQNGDGYGDGILQQTFNPVTHDPADFHYYFFHGTSMAAPHVAGATALLIANGIATTPDEVRSALESTAKDLGQPGRDNIYGHGLIQVAGALAWDGGSPGQPTPPPTRPTPTFTPAPLPGATPTPDSDWEARVVQLINSERVDRGKPRLSIDSRLVQAARRHSQDMADNNIFSHYGSDGSSPFDRIRAAGYRFRMASEAIGGGYGSPEQVVEAWMNSPLHRSILLGNYTDVGVGYVHQPDSAYRHYWTADLAIPSGRASVTLTPTVIPTIPLIASHSNFLPVVVRSP
jgi:serine protease